MFTMRILHILHAYHADPAMQNMHFVYALVRRKKIIVFLEYLRGLGHRIEFKYLHKNNYI
jgi:hypothetical protein